MYTEKRLNRSALIFWYKRAHSKRIYDREKLKELYTGLALLTEEERNFLYEKYFCEGKKSDKTMGEQYGLTEKKYRKTRLSIEHKLYNFLRRPKLQDDAKRQKTYQVFIENMEKIR